MTSAAISQNSPVSTTSKTCDCISQKAGEVFAQRGFAQVGMRELCSHLGIANGSIYYHIESKQALLFELIEDLYQTLLAANARTLKRGMSAQQRLSLLLKQHIELHACKASQLVLAEREAHCLSPEHRAQVDSLRAEYEQQLTTLLGEVATHASQSDLQQIAASLVSMLNSLPGWFKHTFIDARRQHRFLLKAIQALLHEACAGATHGALEGQPG